MQFYVCENFLTAKECEEWMLRAPVLPNKHWNQMQWTERRRVLTEDPVVDLVLDFQKETLGMETTCYEAAYQIFPNTSWSFPHIHTMPSRQHEDYTTLVYLNDDYQEGELYTVKWDEELTNTSPTVIPGFGEVDLVFKPKKGTLVMFDSMNIYHGVNRVRGPDRHSLVFWFHKTTFIDDRREAFNVSNLKRG